MVFDNCQIDVFFHMRSHYNRLRNVQSVVDCSAPKGFKPSSQSEASFKNEKMPHPNSSFGMNKHNCGYGNHASNLRPALRTPRAKSLPPRPDTRRHPEDMPCVPRICTKSPINPCFDKWTAGTSRSIPNSGEKDKATPNRTCRTAFECKSGSAKSKSPHQSTLRSVRLNTPSNYICQPVSVQYCQPMETPLFPTPTGTPICRDVDKSPQDHEYLQFLLKITEDIIKNDLYTNKEMKKVFLSHINANKERLNLNRMLLQINELMNELNIPLNDDAAEDTTPSWTEIKTAIQGLLCIEKIKPKETPRARNAELKFKNTPGYDKTCVCFDMKTFNQNLFEKHKPVELEIDNHNYEDFISKKNNKSLDRLTERTEPISSRATCKASTATSCSTFGNIDVLPGFECLETPKASKCVMVRISPNCRKQKKCRRKSSRDRVKAKKKMKVSKRRYKAKIRSSKSKSRSPQRIDRTPFENAGQTNTLNQNKRTDSDVEVTKGNPKPAIITLQECKNSTENSTGDSLCLKNSRNDYVLVKGPMYLLKTFLDENPNVIMRMDLPTPSKRRASSTLVIKGMNVDKKTEDEKKVEKTRYEAELVQDAPVPQYTVEENNTSEVTDEKKYTQKRCMEDCPNAPSCSSKILKGLEALDDYELFPPQRPKLCRLPCPKVGECALQKVSNPKEREPDNKLLTNDYDLTPHKDVDTKKDVIDEEVQKDINSKSSINATVDRGNNSTVGIPILLQDFISTKQIQTEDLHLPPVTIATLFVHNEDAKDIVSAKSDELVAQISSEGPFQETVEAVRKPDNRKISKDRVSLPKTTQTARTSVPESIEKFIKTSSKTKTSSELKVPPEIKTGEEGRDLGNSTQTLTSTATLGSVNQVLAEEEPVLPKAAKTLRHDVNSIEIRRISSSDDASDFKEAAVHQRRVSILKNPIVQIPIEKIFSENADESKKTGESIIRTVEVMKERQSNRDNFLAKAIQDIESNRETRLSERLNALEKASVSASRVPILTTGGLPSRREYLNVKGMNTAETMSLEDNYVMNLSPSYDELPIKITSLKKKGSLIEASESLTTGDINSEQVLQPNLLSEFDDQPELTVSPNQLKQINEITTKLEQFRHANDKDEREISATLDKLVDTMKEQYALQEEAHEIPDERSESPSTKSRRSTGLICCGCIKRKRSFHNRSIHDFPQQHEFSEAEYKSKSEAFDMALSSLGQQMVPKDEHASVLLRRGSRKNDDDSKDKVSIVHSGNRLSLVRITDMKNRSSITELNLDFNAIGVQSQH